MSATTAIATNATPEHSEALALFDPAKPMDKPQELITTGESTPFIAFCNPKMKAYPAVITKCGPTPEGTPLYFLPDNTIKRVDTLTFWVAKYDQYFAVLDDNNGIVKATFAQPPDFTFRECIEAVIVFHTHDGCFPARCTFRMGRASCIKEMADEFAMIRDKPQEWAAKSADHAAAMSAIKMDWLRVCCNHSASKQKGKKPPHREYWLASANPRPTSAGQAKAITAFTKNAGGMATLQASLVAHKARIDEVRSKT